MDTEAFERAKAAYGTGAYDDATLEFLFPQLKESDDERIRKKMIEHFKSKTKETWCNIPVKDILAYLEKQKEQKPSDFDTFGFSLKNSLIVELGIEDEQASSFVDIYGKELFQLATGEIKIEIDEHDLAEYKKEQKPAEWSYPYGENETVDRLVSIAECLEMDGDCLFNGYTGTECGKFLRDLARKQVECKPAEWSEEDKKALQGVTEVFMNYGVNIVNYPAFVHWLKDLPNRITLQPKQGWSEEEEELWGRCIIDLGYLKGYEPHCKKRYDEEINWLKSIRPQPKQPSLSDKEIVCLKRTLDYLRKEHNRDGGSDTDFTNEIAVLEWLITHPVLVYSSQPHWKPSKEQMEALDKAIPVCMAAVGRDAIAPLESLYEQLKKLI